VVNGGLNTDMAQIVSEISAMQRDGDKDPLHAAFRIHHMVRATIAVPEPDMMKEAYEALT